jgi:hypothetical protein
LKFWGGCKGAMLDHAIEKKKEVTHIKPIEEST